MRIKGVHGRDSNEQLGPNILCWRVKLTKSLGKGLSSKETAANTLVFPLNEIISYSFPYVTLSSWWIITQTRMKIWYFNETRFPFPYCHNASEKLFSDFCGKDLKISPLLHKISDIASNLLAVVYWSGIWLYGRWMRILTYFHCTGCGEALNGTLKRKLSCQKEAFDFSWLKLWY